MLTFVMAVDLKLSTKFSTTITWIGMKFSTDVHDPQRMIPDDFGDPLTFPLVPPHKVL